MNLTTTCPACGSQISLSTGEKTAKCDFCGSHYEVDFSETQPALKVITPEEIVPEPLPVQSAETESVVLDPPQPMFEPAVRFDPPAPMQAQPVTTSPAKRNTTWITVAIIVMAVLCSLCACLVLFSLVYNFSAQ